MVYKRQLDFKHSYPSGCDTSKLLSDDLENELYYDGFWKVLYHYSHQEVSTECDEESIFRGFFVICVYRILPDTAGYCLLLPGTL